MYVVFDYDGTLALVEHRRHHIANGNKNWRQFFAECVNDAPHVPVVKAMKTHICAAHRVEVWSGRSDEVEAESRQWLNDNVFDGAADYLRFMRPEKDYRSDVELKREWLNKVRDEEGIQPDLIYDDRQCVVDMWREEGLVCAQVAPGDFDKPKQIGPKGSLTLLIGPSGAGKSRAANNSIDAGANVEVVSSDDIRLKQFGVQDGKIHPDAYTPAGFKRTFATLDEKVKASINGGIDTIVDATNLRRKNRVDLLEAVGADDGSVDVTYYLIDRPLNDKLKSWNPEAIHTTPDIIEKQHNTFQATVRDALKGDGFDFVDVMDRRQYD